MSQPFRTDPSDRLRAGLDDPAFDRGISAEALLVGVEDRRRKLVHRRRQRLTVTAASAAAALVVGGVAVIGNRAPEVTPAQQPVVAPAPADPANTSAPSRPSPDPVVGDEADRRRTEEVLRREEERARAEAEARAMAAAEAARAQEEARLRAAADAARAAAEAEERRQAEMERQADPDEAAPTSRPDPNGGG